MHLAQGLAHHTCCINTAVPGVLFRNGHIQRNWPSSEEWGSFSQSLLQISPHGSLASTELC